MVDARYRLIHGDALYELPRLESASADACVTDPPYSSGGLHRSDRTQAPSKKYVSSGAEVRGPEFAGDARDQRSYTLWSAVWMGQVFRVLRPGSPLCVFIDWRNISCVIDAMQVAGFIYRGIVPWDKTEGRGRPESGRFRGQCEFVTCGHRPDSSPERLEVDPWDPEFAVWGSKGVLSDRAGMPPLPGCIRHAPSLVNRIHITEKPIEVMAPLVEICRPGGRVLDPFCGSAAGGEATLLSGREYLGIELDELCFRDAEARMAGVLPLFAGAS